MLIVVEARTRKAVWSLNLNLQIPPNKKMQPELPTGRKRAL